MISLHSIAKLFLKIETLKDIQTEVITAIISGRDVLSIMATGSGKSCCFQVPSIYLHMQATSAQTKPSVTLVISPLISLMKDQVSGLNELGVPATYLNSSLTNDQSQARLQKLLLGEYVLLYLSPEKLLSKKFQEILSSLSVPLVVIDEAHCVSEWGHDFRPEYRLISTGVDKIFPRPVFAAFTATATPEVCQDICASLMLSKPGFFKGSFERSNLYVKVKKCSSSSHRLLAILRLLHRHPNQSGIIYCPTRAKTEEISATLSSWGYNCNYYHGGMTAETRDYVQESFICNKIKLIAATSAFGMGVNKTDVRFVIHCGFSSSLESYYQEIGRGGRDGQKSWCYSLLCPEDEKLQLEIIGKNFSKRRWLRFQNLLEFTLIKSCRFKYLLKYFGEDTTEVCSHCDNCSSEVSRKQALIPDLEESMTTSDDDKSVFLKLLKIRDAVSKLITKDGSAVVAQSQLQFMSLLRPRTHEDFFKIPGIGKGWVGMYADYFDIF